MARRKKNANLLGRKSSLRQLGESYFGEKYPQRSPVSPKPSHKARRQSQLRAAEQKRIAKIRSQANPASAEQYRLAQAVLSGTARQTGMTKKAAREIVDRTPARMRSEFMKRNPVDSAAALSEAWHGTPATTETEYIDKVHVHEVLTDLGRLMELKVWVSSRHCKSISFDKSTRLASNERGEQLYIVGGDQSLDLGSLGITGHAAEKDLVNVASVYSVTYVTAKHHLGKQDRIPGPYEHVFCEKSQEEPILVYDTMNQECGFAGGEYHIPMDDIDGRYSSGIND